MSTAPAVAQDPVARLPSIADKTAGMEKIDGFFELYWDARKGTVWLRPRLDEPFLYATALGSGLGSNPVGLDRASLGPSHLATFERAGGKVLLVANNTRFRAISDNPRERNAVADSFATAVLWGFPIGARTDADVLVDATAFFLRDATDIAGRLAQRGQGSYALDAARSAVARRRIAGFPDNVEVEATLTFAGAKAGPEVSATSATGRALTLRVRHSLVRLPDRGYRPRRFDPRVGYFTIAFSDYAAAISEPLHHRWITRHRLVPRDPSAKQSDPVEPIVYYLDPGMPEPIRSAVREGASWWADAFAAAGLTNAFSVEDLPPDADPLDVRYNVIHWVHRATRGWSYGASVVDPRTGEILKGNVLLGSLRVRQDHLLLSSLHGPHDGCAAGASPAVDYLLPADDGLAERIALARLRQLAAHEVGHTLGLAHNFAASSYGRASVMDYPAPLVRPAEDGSLDFTDAYAVGIGAYDTWAIRYGYAHFAPDGEADGLGAVIDDGLRRGMIYLTDQDARATSTCHPLASLWDNGSDATAALLEQLRVREIGLRQFGQRNLRAGTPLAHLEDLFVPLYLHHRFQLEAALKVIGGVDYRHAVKDDGQPAVRPATDQRAALDAVLRTLHPEFLTAGTALVRTLPPKPPGHPAAAERFPRSTGGPADTIAMAVACADLTVTGLLERHRVARLLDQQARPPQLGLRDVLDALVAVTWRGPAANGAAAAAVRDAVRSLVADRLLDLARDARARTAARAAAQGLLAELMREAKGTGTPLDLEIARRITAFFDGRATQPARSTPPQAPPGSPIGTPHTAR